MNNILNIKNRYEFRLWLMENSVNEKECFIKLKRGKPVDSNVFYYLDAVEEALCFGWIDSTLTLIDGIRYQRFSKRNKNSVWSELNKERVRRLEKLGLMTDMGRNVLPQMDYSFDEVVIEELKKNGVYDNFIKFPILYQKIRVYNVAFYRNKDINTYNKALENLISNTKKNKLYGEWNDYGRLLNY